MNLLVDIGNTSVNWALASGQQLERRGQFVHRGSDLARQLESAWGRLAAPGRILVSNVAGEALAGRLCAWVGRSWQVCPHFIRAGRQAAGVTNAYAQPELLGADRWAAMIAAWQATGDAVCVVDCGTAITVDLVDADGVHRGGLILPGVKMMQQALCAHTADLPLPHADQAPVLLATTTSGAIDSGSLYAAAAAVERIATDMAASSGLQPAVVITGGDAQRLAPLLGLVARYDADLVLKGIAILAGEN
ncbi:MAG TPA: type III pantothenate kinase [Gammaproteobacteria bacterium]|nr:type III pantothenate kinase [Gammaproteobacteria bacterium]